VTLGRIALEPIDEPGLGRAEKEPVITGLLQRDEELLAAVDYFLVDLVPSFEFGLESKLATQWMVRAALPPNADVDSAVIPLPKSRTPRS
jgi:hypothetical protein